MYKMFKIGERIKIIFKDDGRNHEELYFGTVVKIINDGGYMLGQTTSIQRYICSDVPDPNDLFKSLL